MAKSDEWLLPDNLLLVQGWARDGLSVVEIARNMGISKTTLYEYVKKFPALAEAVRAGKEHADYTVENAFFKSCTGYYVEEFSVDLNGNNRKTRRWVPPSTAAQIFWLVNRRPERWKQFRKDADDGSALKKLDGALEKINEAMNVDS